jgi:hypothetical protein
MPIVILAAIIILLGGAFTFGAVSKKPRRRKRKPWSAGVGHATGSDTRGRCPVSPAQATELKADPTFRTNPLRPQEMERRADSVESGVPSRFPNFAHAGAGSEDLPILEIAAGLLGPEPCSDPRNPAYAEGGGARPSSNSFACTSEIGRFSLRLITGTGTWSFASSTSIWTASSVQGCSWREFIKQPPLQGSICDVIELGRRQSPFKSERLLPEWRWPEWLSATEPDAGRFAIRRPASTGPECPNEMLQEKTLPNSRVKGFSSPLRAFGQKWICNNKHMEILASTVN